ncbi:MAG: NADH-quinone oxidoreductase subunit NuoE [bacterium]|nr:NADH-quinone oxidoreductase subunit NuoE [bacterium]
MVGCNCETKLKGILDEYRGKSGSLIPVLQKTQDLYGYIPKEAMEEIAQGLGMLTSEVYGVVTFYTQFRLTPVGKNIIKACHGTACHVGGAKAISEAMEKALGIKNGETTKDKKFTLEEVACLGCCSLAPVVMINEDTYANLSESNVASIFENY